MSGHSTRVSFQSDGVISQGRFIFMQLETSSVFTDRGTGSLFNGVSFQSYTAVWISVFVRECSYTVSRTIRRRISAWAIRPWILVCVPKGDTGPPFYSPIIRRLFCTTLYDVGQARGGLADSIRARTNNSPPSEQTFNLLVYRGRFWIHVEA